MSAKMYLMSKADVTGQLQVYAVSPSVKRGLVSNTRLPRAKMLLVPENVFSGGQIIRKKVLTEEMCFLPLISY